LAICLCNFLFVHTLCSVCYLIYVAVLRVRAHLFMLNVWMFFWLSGILLVLCVFLLLCFTLFVL